LEMALTHVADEPWTESPAGDGAQMENEV
jgi:hypothetical protein